MPCRGSEVLALLHFCSPDDDVRWCSVGLLFCFLFFQLLHSVKLQIDYSVSGTKFAVCLRLRSSSEVFRRTLLIRKNLQWRRASPADDHPHGRASMWSGACVSSSRQETLNDRVRLFGSPATFRQRVGKREIYASIYEYKKLIQKTRQRTFSLKKEEKKKDCKIC